MKILASQLEVGDFLQNFGCIIEIVSIHEDRAVTKQEKPEKENPFKKHSRLAAEAVENAYIQETVGFLVKTTSGKHTFLDLDQEIVIYKSIAA